MINNGIDFPIIFKKELEYFELILITIENKVIYSILIEKGKWFHLTNDTYKKWLFCAAIRQFADLSYRCLKVSLSISIQIYIWFFSKALIFELSLSVSVLLFYLWNYHQRQPYLVNFSSTPSPVHLMFQIMIKTIYFKAILSVLNWKLVNLLPPSNDGMDQSASTCPLVSNLLPNA